MLPITEKALNIITGSHRRYVRVESWLDRQLLAANVPITDGSEEADSSMSVPERIVLRVPRISTDDDGNEIDWAPTSPTAPLAAYGQRLRVSLGIDVGNGDVEWIPRGWFLVTGSSTEWDQIRVECQSLLSLIEEAKFVAPFQPSGQLTEVVQALVHPALPVRFTGLSDRAAPSGLSWDQDRIGGLFELLDAWPAHASMAPDGVLEIAPPPTNLDASVLTVSDIGNRSTILRRSGNTARDGSFNTVVAKGKGPDGEQIQGTATDNTIGSPFAISGPYNPLPVPYFFQSDFLSTVEQCRLAAANRLYQLRSRSALTATVTMIPNPAIRLNDTWLLNGEEFINQRAQVDKFSLPYMAGGGSMSVTLRLI